MLEHSVLDHLAAPASDAAGDPPMLPIEQNGQFLKAWTDVATTCLTMSAAWTSVVAEATLSTWGAAAQHAAKSASALVPALEPAAPRSWYRHPDGDPVKVATQMATSVATAWMPLFAGGTQTAPMLAFWQPFLQASMPLASMAQPPALFPGFAAPTSMFGAVATSMRTAQMMPNLMAPWLAATQFWATSAQQVQQQVQEVLAAAEETFPGAYRSGGGHAVATVLVGGKPVTPRSPDRLH
jgi:hypothetical protein